jgi:uncharacterized protein GlcG (DUF336 family)
MQRVTRWHTPVTTSCQGMGTGRHGHRRSGYGKRASDSPGFWDALYTISGGRIAPVPGGVLVLHEEQVIGAVGMSGDVSDNDEACAIAGVQEAGFEAVIGEEALGKQ